MKTQTMNPITDQLDAIGIGGCVNVAPISGEPTGFAVAALRG